MTSKEKIMKITLNLVLFFVLSIGIGQISYAQSVGSDAPTPQPVVQFESRTGVSTLFALDPITQSLCFRDGGPGSVFQEGQTRNRCSDLNFNSYSANSFSVGVEGGRQGVIIDLGTPLDLKTKYGYMETVGNGQGFASLDVVNGKALILKDYKARTLQQLTNSSELFSNWTDKTSSAAVKLGHVYLIRITDQHDKSFETVAKVLVVGYTPNESVTLRWHLLSNNQTAKL
jgi:hypothetical protein